MMIKQLVILVVIGILVAGCATTMTPNGMQSGLFTGNKVPMYDPTQKVDPSQTANKGADGHAAALALGDIKDAAARADAKDAMIAISENSSLWGRGSRSGGLGPRGQTPIIAGRNEAFGRLYNSFDYPVAVQIKGFGSSYLFGPGESIEISLPYGTYNLMVYSGETGLLMGHNEINTNYRRKSGDNLYDFNVRIDAESAY